MNDSILKDVVTKLSVDQPMAIIFQDGEVKYPSIGIHPSWCNTPHVQVILRQGSEAYVSSRDLSSAHHKYTIAVIVYGGNNTMACMTKDENYAHGFGFGSTEKAFHLLEIAEVWPCINVPSAIKRVWNQGLNPLMAPQFPAQRCSTYPIRHRITCVLTVIKSTFMVWRRLSHPVKVALTNTL